MINNMNNQKLRELKQLLQELAQTTTPLQRNIISEAIQVVEDCQELNRLN